MAKTVPAALATDEIAFELERFELEHERLILSGRWFGVRGRRFVRPTLTPVDGHDLSRVLADLEHKPWPAENGERWEATFPWDQDGGVTKFELSVAPDIAIQLPSPTGTLARPRRLVALPREPAKMAAWRRPAPDDKSAVLEVAPPQVDVEALRGELESSRAGFEAARGVLADRQAELEALKGELAAAIAARDGAVRESGGAASALEQLQAAYDQLTREHLQLRNDLQQLVRERDQLVADLALPRRALDDLRSELDQARRALEDAVRERDEAVRRRDDAVAAHGAALVMRGATRVGSHHGEHPAWWRQALAILALTAVVFAILIVAHVL